MVKGSIVTTVLAIALLWSHPLLAQDEAARLYEEARALVEIAEKITNPGISRALLHGAQTHLEILMRDHSDSAVSAQLVLGDPLQRRLQKLMQEASDPEIGSNREPQRNCEANPSGACVLDLAVASAVATERSRDRVTALLIVADAYHEVGEIEGRDAILELAIMTARAIANAATRDTALREIAITQAKLTQFDSALATTQMIGDRWQGSQAAGGIAAHLAKAGRTDAAIGTIQSIDDPSLRARFLGDVSAALAEAGNTEAALVIAREIDEPNMYARAIGKIALVRAAEGSYEAALLTLRSQNINISDLRTEMSDWEIGDVAGAQAEAGDIEAAYITAKGIDHAWPRARALAAIAVAQEKHGERDAAVQTHQLALSITWTIDDAWERSRSLSDIASLYANAGQTDTALEIASAIEEVPERWWALGNIAPTQASAGKHPAAVKTAMSINEGWLRARALAAIAIAIKP